MLGSWKHLSFSFPVETSEPTNTAIKEVLFFSPTSNLNHCPTKRRSLSFSFTFPQHDNGVFVAPLSLKVQHTRDYLKQTILIKQKFSAGLDRFQSPIFKAKLIPSRAEQLGGELENQIYCFIKDKHSIWKSILLGTAKPRRHFLNVNM